MAKKMKKISIGNVVDVKAQLCDDFIDLKFSLENSHIQFALDREELTELINYFKKARNTYSKKS